MTMLADPPAIAIRRTPKRWTKAEYNDAVESGLLRDRRIYLYRGELIQMASMGALHAQGVKRVTYWLVETFRPAFEVRIQMPFELVDESEPQPDGGVFTAEQDARRPHPNAAVLIIEVCDSSIELDQEIAFEYAAAGLPDYWLVNVRDRVIEVYRQPVADPASPTGHRYVERQVYATGQSLAPLARPDAVVAVATLVDVG